MEDLTTTAAVPCVQANPLTVKRMPRMNGMLNDAGFGDLVKALYWDTQGLCLFMKRLERGRFMWPSPADGTAHLTAAQLAMLLEGIDWRAPRRTWRPELAG